jgi:phage replication O-like protein O
VANPQAEDGHVDIANDIVDALARIRISGEESQVLWIILRKTYGWHKKEDWISLSQFCLSTGIKKNNVCRALSKLIMKNIVIKKENDYGTTYQFQKNFDEWNPLSKKRTFSKKRMTIIKKEKESLSKKRHTKETLTKETLTKENILSSFETFWKEYPNKKKKGGARKTWLKIKPDDLLIHEIMEALKRARNSIEWTKDKGEYIPHPATWLNAEGWHDVYKPLQSADQYPTFKDDPAILDMARSWRNK